MKTYVLGLASAALLSSGWAQAAEPGSDEPKLLTAIGMSAEIGGGVGGFLDSRATSVTQPQGLWTARLTVGTRSHLGGEAAYIGGAQALNALGVGTYAILMANGVEGNVRVNVLTGNVQPYAIAGVGWLHYSLQNTSTNTSDVRDQSDVAIFPVGVGLAFRYQGWVADLRVALHPTANANLMPSANLSTWNAGARVGFEF